MITKDEAIDRPDNMVAVPLDKLQDMQSRLKALEGKEFFERGKEIARWADKTVQEGKENVFNLAEKFGFIRYKDGIDWSSNYDKELVALVKALLKECSNHD